ncbi:MAG: SpoIIE family protein phosphatase [Candidatus Eisenbacteria bacterium]|nr:SpoIIE family protein phosphatase [Candidatus Eisenbacteria bacterium]
MTRNRSDASGSSIQAEHEALLEAVSVIASSFDVDTVLQRLLYLTHRMLGFEYCTILLIGDDGRRLEVAARHGYPDSIVQDVELSVGRGVTGRVAATGKPLFVPDVDKEEHYLAGLRGARSELVVPMKFGDQVIGVFDVQSPDVDAFDESRDHILSVLASVASVAIVNARNHVAALRSRDEASKRSALERQLTLARAVQEHLLPRSDPSLQGFDVAGVNLPGETLSGDYFDYIDLPGGSLGVTVADVSGEGVPAALLAASLQGMLRAHIENVYSISAIFERANMSLAATSAPEDFATLFYCVLERDGTLSYVNAGHNPPIILRDGGGVEELTEGGTVLGMFPGQRYPHGRTRLRQGDYMVAYTDGLTEAIRDEEEFGAGRVIETMKRVQGAPARIMASVLVTEADAFAGPGTAPDDMTVVVVRRLPPE